MNDNQINLILERNRMKKIHFKVTHSGKLIIGDTSISCAVLENGQRIITQSSIYKTFGKQRRGSQRDENTVIPYFITSKNFIAFLDKDLRKVFEEVEYISKNGRVVKGYKAETIPAICDIFIEAHSRKALMTVQEPLYEQSLILMRALAKVGITALIDEATGYQNDRQAQELQNLLAKFIGEDLLKWQKRFPKQYYKEMFRLHNWEYDENSNKRPGYAGSFTMKYVYDLFPESVIEYIKRENPKSISNNRLYRHHQFLSVDIGVPELDRHISKLLGVMALSDNISDFEKNFKKAFAIELERKKKDTELKKKQNESL